MTRRLYYDDAYMTHFTARVLERLEVEGQPAVALDQTCFYPTGGGQPNDRGEISGQSVLDVFTREVDLAVVHVLNGVVEGDDVDCAVDWTRRFDHMQQHAGQHILTQAFVQVADAHTVGFHLSPDTVTIDLDAAQLSSEAINQAEDLANQVVYANMPVTARMVAPDETEGVRIRRLPGQLTTSALRVIQIGDFDATACGGTHVARTGEISVIKVIRLEKRGDKSRIEFRCGWRALHDYRQKHSTLSQMAAALSCRFDEAAAALGQLQQQYVDSQRALKAAQGALLDNEAEKLLAAAEMRDGVRLVRGAFDQRDVAELKLLANRLTQSKDVIALLGTAGEKAQFLLARSANLPHDMNALIRRLLAAFDGARGGGQPALAQGGGVRLDVGQVQAALESAWQVIANQDGG